MHYLKCVEPSNLAKCNYKVSIMNMKKSKKSKFMCVQNNSDITNFNNCISMKDGSSIEYVKECVHLGNTIYRVCQKKERHFKYICKVANN